MNSEQKIAYRIVQVYKLKNIFWKITSQNGSFHAIGESDFFQGTKKQLNKICKTTEFWAFLEENASWKYACEMDSFRRRPSEGVKNKIRSAAL